MSKEYDRIHDSDEARAWHLEQLREHGEAGQPQCADVHAERLRQSADQEAAYHATPGRPERSDDQRPQDEFPDC